MSSLCRDRFNLTENRYNCLGNPKFEKKNKKFNTDLKAKAARFYQVSKSRLCTCSAKLFSWMETFIVITKIAAEKIIVTLSPLKWPCHILSNLADTWLLRAYWSTLSTRDTESSTSQTHMIHP